MVSCDLMNEIAENGFSEMMTFWLIQTMPF